ncbi:hypothetical protein [Actinokineospora enzanensis]|uniref:hypothetical protein n=1 Tax=Actinokineospora enzanensis TaxID=155975 RepID=UPI0003787FF1|nr:hypothetical protein [Actinokineospora enzanensis]
MKRRNFLVGSAFTAAAFAEPALFALTTPQVEGVARATGGRIGLAEAEIVHENVVHLRRLDHQYGSGRVREQVVRLLGHEAARARQGSYSETTGRALLGAVARLADLAAGTSIDIGRHALAQRHQIQALNLAVGAGDRMFAADVLVRMSHMAVLVGQGAPTTDGRRRNARQGLALARAGRSLAGTAPIPTLTTALHAVEARGHALLDDAVETRRSMRAAELAYARTRPSAEPDHLHYAEGQFAADLGRCLRDIGDGQESVRELTRALDTNPPHRVRSRCIIEADLAASYLVTGEHEQAASLGRTAVRTATTMTSARVTERLRVLRSQVRAQPRSSGQLTDLDSRVTRLLADNP